MNHKILSLFILTAIILTAVASATVYEVNNVYDGNTGKALTGVSVIGYTCQDEACNTAIRLWPATMNTGDDNTIVLSYPTELQTEYGYAIYFFKPGYFPYKVRADWYGEGRTPKDYTVKLYKLTETASSQIENFDISDTSVKTGETITITADVLSPRINTNNIQFIPAELKDNYYSDKVKVSLLVDGRVTETKNLNMFWSTEQEVEFEFTPENEGDYTVQIITEITDNKFLSTQEKSAEENIVVKGETPVEDKDAPVITINYPINGKTYNSYVNYLKFEVKDESPVSCKYSTDNGATKKNIDCDIKKIEINSKEGENTWIIYATDSYGNSAEKSITFTIKLDNDDNQNKTPTGYRNLNKGSTWEDTQYENQFKPVVLTGESGESVKLSIWQKFINWVKYIFRSLFWFLD